MYFKAQTTLQCQDRTPTTQTTPQRDRSQPKFNRKQDLRHPERRKPEAPCDIAARICYISPGKSTITPPYGISNMLSPTFEQIAHKFAVQDSSMFRSSASNQQQNSRRNLGTLSNVMTEQSDAVQDERDQQIVLCHLEIQKMREEIEQCRGINKELKRKIKHFQGIQEFLEEREGYITELMRREAETNQRLQANLTMVKEMEKQITALRKEIDEAKQAYLIAEREHYNQVEIQKAEIEWILRLNIKFQQQIKQLKNPPCENPFILKSKENSQSTRSNPRRINKSKSITFLQTFPSNLPIEQMKTDSWKQLIPTNDTETPPSYTSETQGDDDSFELEGAEVRKIVKKLKQKMKYYQIEIDILKRLKLDCGKIKDDNEKLKKQNRKLLQRVDYLMQNHSRRGNNSDSSLELSLSPKKM